MVKKKTISAYVEEEDLSLLHELADARDISMSNLVKEIVENYVYREIIKMRRKNSQKVKDDKG